MQAKPERQTPINAGAYDQNAIEKQQQRAHNALLHHTIAAAVA